MEVFSGGRSTEHEISVISASQAMHAINRDKYDVTPIYITKQGKFYTGEALFDVANYPASPRSQPGFSVLKDLLRPST